MRCVTSDDALLNGVVLRISQARCGSWLHSITIFKVRLTVWVLHSTGLLDSG